MNLSKFNEYIAIDLETTGLDRENDHVIEIALCHFVDGAPTRKFQSLIAPEEEVRSFQSNAPLRLSSCDNESV